MSICLVSRKAPATGARLPFLRPALGLFTGLVLVVSGCGDPEPPPVAAAVEVPPSLQMEAVAATNLVRLDARQVDQLDVRTEAVSASAMPFSLRVPGEVLPAPEHFALVSAPISGRIVRIHAHEGEAVRQGQILLELESLEYAGLVADVMRARAELSYQQQQAERLKQLVEKKIAAQNTLEKTEADLSRAKAEYSAANARISALGISPETVAGWSEETGAGPMLAVRAPITGVIDQHDIDLGQSVTAYQQMMSLVNPAHVLIRGFVPPEEAELIQSGDTVSIQSVEAQGRRLLARIATINPALGEENRSVIANILAATENGWPRPGQAVQVDIRAQSAPHTLSVPLAAVLYEGNRASVFVKAGDNGFEQRIITLGRLTDDRAQVVEGLREGEEVATTQVFNLKALSRFEQFGEE
ncbi:MAG: efflux RND transporter periplasmic adaptor subunit [Rhodothermales bacterium]